MLYRQCFNKKIIKNLQKNIDNRESFMYVSYYENERTNLQND